MPYFTQVYDSTFSHELVGLGFSGWICFLCDERKGRNGVVTVMDCWSSLKLFDFDINREEKKKGCNLQLYARVQNVSVQHLFTFTCGACLSRSTNGEHLSPSEYEPFFHCKCVSTRSNKVWH
jgi:hypothetical protein